MNPTSYPSLYLDGIIIKQTKDLFSKGIKKSDVWKGEM